MSRTAAPLFVLRALWRPAAPGSRVPSGPEAQALEYAAAMGPAALWRQWQGADGTRRRIERRLTV